MMPQDPGTRKHRTPDEDRSDSKRARTISTPPPSPPSSDAWDEERLFAACFAGNAQAQAFCRAVDVVGSGQTASSEDIGALESPDFVHLTSAAGLGWVGEQNATLLDDAALAAFNKRKNAARVAFHASLEERLESRLDALLLASRTRVGSRATAAEALPTSSAALLEGSTGGDYSAARAAITALAARHGLAAASLLQGLRAALLQQAAASTRVTWRLPRANLLNGGETFLVETVGLLHEVGLEQSEVGVAEALEGGAGQQGETQWSVRQRFWARSQLKSLAGLVRVNSDMAATGTVLLVNDVFEALPDPFLFGWCNVL